METAENTLGEWKTLLIDGEKKVFVAPPVVINSLKGDASDKDTNTLVGDYPIGGEMLDTIAPS